MAECHPVGFQWVMEAKRRGATIIHVDPRFTRTSAVADIHVPIRAGSDIAFLGGIIRYILENERYFREYVVNYTNAAGDHPRRLPGHGGPRRALQRLEQRKTSTNWFVGLQGHAGDTGGGEREQFTGEPRLRAGADPAEGVRPHTAASPMRFPDSEAPLSRYTPEMVEETCGIPGTLFLKVAETLCENSGRERTSAFCYAVGWTQHSVGVQYIRTAAIIQQLLGNMGRPGGGIMALRGHASIQGSTDIPTLYNLLPGYLPMPKASTTQTFAQLPREQRGAFRLVDRVSQVHGVPDEGVVRGCRDERDNDWCYRLSAAC